MPSDWMKGMPGKEVSIHYEICKPLEDLISQAHREQDPALLRAAASAWLLAGFSPAWVVEPLRVPNGRANYTFVEDALRGRNRRKVRNEGLGLLRAFEALHRVGAFSVNRP